MATRKQVFEAWLRKTGEQGVQAWVSRQCSRRRRRRWCLLVTRGDERSWRVRVAGQTWAEVLAKIEAMR